MSRRIRLGLWLVGWLVLGLAWPQATVAGPPQQQTPTPTLTATPPAEDAEVEEKPPIIHVVQAGETLFEIAYQYGTTVEAIAAANQLADPGLLAVGQKLIIPTAGSEVTAPPPAPSLVPAVALPGDSLLAVARRFDAPVETVAKQNGVLHPGRQPAGQILLVEDRPPLRVHVVNPDEGLTRLAARYGLSPWTLSQANDLSSPAALFPGQRLIVPSLQISPTTTPLTPTVGVTPSLPAPFRVVEIGPLPTAQGHTLQVQVSLSQTTPLKGAFAGKGLNFAQENGAYYAMVGVNAFTQPGIYPLALLVTDTQGSQVYLSQEIEVASGGYGREVINVPPDRENLLDPATVQAELEWLGRIKTVYNPERYWDGLFSYPVENPEITSYFGTRRSYNGGPYSSFHSGVDFNGVTGDTVYAPAAGVVVAAQELTVRGNVILIDHGWGVYTGYWHLSQIDVTVGQQVAPGDAIGLLGNTGLSTGAHLHWEFWVGGESVTALQWTEQVFP